MGTTKIHDALTKVKDMQTLNLRMKRPGEIFHFNEPILKTTKLGFIRLILHNSMFNITENNYQFIYSNRFLQLPKSNKRN